MSSSCGLNQWPGRVKWRWLFNNLDKSGQNADFITFQSSVTIRAKPLCYSCERLVSYHKSLSDDLFSV